jgi:hypothetical protein
VYPVARQAVSPSSEAIVGKLSRATLRLLERVLQRAQMTTLKLMDVFEFDAVMFFVLFTDVITF